MVDHFVEAFDHYTHELFVVEYVAALERTLGQLIPVFLDS